MEMPNLLPAPAVPSATARREGGPPHYMALVYLGLHLMALAVFWTGITVAELLLCLVLLQLRGLCVSAGYHRLLAHHSFKTSRVVQFLLAAGACLSLRGGPLWWVALHRHHHRHSDTEADTFTPEKGFLWSYGGWLLSGRFDHTDYQQVRDLTRFPELCWLNRYWLLPSVLLAGLIAWLGGWRGFVTVYCLSSVFLLHVMAWLDCLNHLFGSQRYDTGDGSRNSLWLALLANGEGWHNNHHHYPASARHGFYWWEIDNTFGLLRLLSLFGLVWDVKRIPESVMGHNLIAVKLLGQGVTESSLDKHVLD